MLLRIYKCTCGYINAHQYIIIIIIIIFHCTRQQEAQWGERGKQQTKRERERESTINLSSN